MLEDFFGHKGQNLKENGKKTTLIMNQTFTF